MNNSRNVIPLFVENEVPHVSYERVPRGRTIQETDIQEP